jgi:hypothetical protein
MGKPPPLDPALQRLATESLAHTNEARRQIADLAKSRGASIPPASPTGFDDLQEEIITGLHDLADLQREANRTREPSHPQIVMVDRHKQSSSPPSHRGRGWGAILVGIAAVITALGGSAWLKQCTEDAENAAARHRAAVAPPHS